MVWPLSRVPAFRMACIFACGLAVIALSIYYATRGAHPDQRIEAGHILQAASQQMEIIPLDLTPEPGEISDNTQLQTFFQRQDQISRLMQEPGLRLITPQGTQTLQFVKIKSSDLPLLFWIQVTVGLGAFLIAGWIFSLRAFDRVSQPSTMRCSMVNSLFTFFLIMATF